MSDRTRSAFERALRFSRRRRLFPRGTRVLVGSGSGSASLGVLGFLRLAQHDLELGEVAVAAVDVGTDDSADAAADTGRFARVLGVNFHAVSADRRGVLPTLLAFAAREGFNRVALGHTREDAVARVLAQIVRGAGLMGLRPFVARRRDGVVRPFLDLSVGEALELARTAGIEPVQLPPEPQRRASLEERLRTSVLPRLRVESHGADAAIVQLAREARNMARQLEAEAHAKLGDARTGGGRWEIPVVASVALAGALARATVQRLQLVGPNAERVIQTLAVLLRSPMNSSDHRERVLGPGLIAAYVPERRVVALRVIHSTRGSEEGIG